MDSCAIYGWVALVLSKTIEEIKEGKTQDYRNLKMRCIILETKLEWGEIEQPCLDCDDCMTFVENRWIVYHYLFKGKDQQWVKEQEQYVRKARGLDQILRHVHSFQVNPE